MSDGIPDFTPVILLTGFLGSGKTTLLGRLLKDPAMSGSAVLINEFGEIGLDHHLLERVDETMVLLESGCLCCTVRGELASALKTLHSKRARGAVPPFNRVIIESTGLADPLPVISTITADPVLKHHFRMGSIITAVDAVNGLHQLEHHRESVTQAAVADRLVLTKTDLCSDDTIAGIKEALRRLNPDAPLVIAANAQLDAQAILGERPDFVSALSGLRCIPVSPDRAGGPHAGSILSFAITASEPLDWTLFGLWLTMVLNRHGSRILRVKGILNVEGSDTPVAIHGVQQLVHVPTHLAAWPSEDRRSKMIFIVDGLDPAAITRSLQAFGFCADPAQDAGRLQDPQVQGAPASL